MTWIVFAAVDLYIGIIILDVISRDPDLTAEKLSRLHKAKRATWVCLGATAVALILKLVL